MLNLGCQNKRRNVLKVSKALEYVDASQLMATNRPKCGQLTLHCTEMSSHLKRFVVAKANKTRR